MVADARYFIIRNDPCRGSWSPKTSDRPNQGSPKTGSNVIGNCQSYIVKRRLSTASVGMCVFVCVSVPLINAATKVVQGF